MVTRLQRVPSTGGLLDANAPAWAQQMVLRLTSLFKPTFPFEPARMFMTVKADLPPAADFPGAIVVVTDQNCLGVSLGGAWLKIILGGPV